VNAEVRAATPGDVPALLSLIEGYRRFERIAGYELLDRDLG